MAVNCIFCCRFSINSKLEISQIVSFNMQVDVRFVSLLVQDINEETIALFIRLRLFELEPGCIIKGRRSLELPCAAHQRQGIRIVILIIAIDQGHKIAVPGKLIH